MIHYRGQLVRSVRWAWIDARKRAALEGRLFRNFRRTAVRSMIRSGVPGRVAMMISVHKTRSVFDRYNTVSETDLREAANRLAFKMGIISGIGLRKPLKKMVPKGGFEGNAALHL